jgi:DNA-binding NtrC family response regulator
VAEVGQAASVLVVEDDASLRLLCRVNLELEGIRVREAERPQGARAALAAERPAVVFLDVHLGGEACDDLLDELIAAGIPVVLMSGTADVSVYSDRVAEVMGKPFEPTALVEAARRYLG